MLYVDTVVVMVVVVVVVVVVVCAYLCVRTCALACAFACARWLLQCMMPLCCRRAGGFVTLACFCMATVAACLSTAAHTSPLLGVLLVGLAFSSSTVVKTTWEHHVKPLGRWGTALFFAAVVGFDMPHVRMVERSMLPLGWLVTLPLLCCARASYCQISEFWSSDCLVRAALILGAATVAVAICAIPYASSPAEFAQFAALLNCAYSRAVVRALKMLPCVDSACAECAGCVCVCVCVCLCVCVVVVVVVVAARVVVVGVVVGVVVVVVVVVVGGGGGSGGGVDDIVDDVGLCVSGVLLTVQAAARYRCTS
jgi:hypothetical protein